MTTDMTNSHARCRLQSGMLYARKSAPSKLWPVSIDLSSPRSAKRGFILGSVRECHGRALLVSLIQRTLGFMACVRRLIQDFRMRRPTVKQIAAVLRQLTPSQLKVVLVFILLGTGRPTGLKRLCGKFSCHMHNIQYLNFIL